jgi:ketosteroid isomerase-like protein
MANNSDKSQIEELVNKWAKAIRAGDMTGVLADHTDDIIMFDVVPPLMVKGIEAYKKQWELFFKYSPGGEGAFDIVEMEITASDSVAFCYALIKVDDLQVRLTLGFRKVGEKWWVAHEHHSVLPEEEQGQ